MALGARAGDVVGMVLRQGTVLTAAGLVLGAAIALIAGRFMCLLFETSPRDPLVFAAVGVSMLAVAIIACVLPALRAARVNPVNALRAD